MKTDSELREYIASHPALSVTTICKNLGSHRIPAARVRALIGTRNTNAPVQPLASAPSRPVVRVRPKTLAEFRKAHDNPQKIRNGLAALADGAYLTEEEFRQFCNIPANFWRRNAELPEFADNKLRHVGVVYWASKPTVQEMKTIIGAA
jgi:hypothetical protein